MRRCGRIGISFFNKKILILCSGDIAIAEEARTNALHISISIFLLAQLDYYLNGGFQRRIRLPNPHPALPYSHGLHRSYPS